MKVTIQKIRCLHCGHAWVPRLADVRRCAKCKTVYWDRKPTYKPRVKETVHEGVGPREEDQGLAE